MHILHDHVEFESKIGGVIDMDSEEHNGLLDVDVDAA